MVVNSNDSAGEGRVSPASASASEPSTSILMKAGVPWRADQRVERRDRHADGSGPGLALPARRAVRRLAEGLRGGRHRRVVDVELELEHARTAADRDRLDRDGAITAIEELQRPDQRGLRLDRHHARAETAEGGDTVADMGADIEDQIARAARTGHRAGPWRRGARDRRSRCAASARRRATVRQDSRHARTRLVRCAACALHRPRCDISIAGSSSARNSGGGSGLLRQSVEPERRSARGRAPARRSPPRAGSTAADRRR